MQQHFELPTELTIYAVSQLRQRWLAWLDAAPDAAQCRVAAAAVDQVDAAGVQLLLALARSLAERGAGLRLVEPSAPLREACAALGAAALLAQGDA